MDLRQITERVAKRASKKSNRFEAGGAPEFEKYMSENHLMSDQEPIEAWIPSEDHLDDKVWVAIVWYGYPSAHSMSLSDRHPDAALQDAVEGIEDFYREEMEEAEREWYKDETGRDLDQDYAEDEVDEDVAQEAYGVAHELIDGHYYTMTKREFAELAPKFPEYLEAELPEPEED